MKSDSKPIRGMENVVIGKRYYVHNADFGKLERGTLTSIEYHVRRDDKVIVPRFYFDYNHGPYQGIFATDCGVIPYIPGGLINPVNTLHEIQEG